MQMRGSAWLLMILVLPGVMAQGRDRKLPVGYEAREFLESTGSQWIDTGYVHRIHDEVVCEIFVPSRQPRLYPAVFGARRHSWRENAFIFYPRFDGQNRPVYNLSGEEARGEGFAYDERVTLVCRDGRANWGRGSIEVQKGTADGGVNTLFIFNVNTAGAGGAQPDSNGYIAMKLYSFRIFDGNRSLKRDFQPCRDPNGASGLYDHVEGKFYALNDLVGPIYDASRDAAFVSSFRDGALAIARRKMQDVENHRKRPENTPVVPLGPRLATGGGFGGFFLWDSVFCVMWARHAEGFPLHSTLDNFYAVQQPDGFICREYDPQGRPCWNDCHPISLNPPILSWAEATLYREGKSDCARLKRVYPALVRFHNCVRTHFRRADGLYFGDALGCGMDDLPRFPAGLTMEQRAKGGIAMFPEAINPIKLPGWWDGWLSGRRDFYSWNKQAGWIDISSQMALDCLSLAEIADALGRAAEAKAYRAEHAELSAAINAKCWDETRGFYFDCTDEGIIPRYHAGALWALLAKVPSAAQAKKVLRAVTDPKVFNRPCGLPALAACEPEYNPESSYWCGSVWPPTTYVAIRGLRAYGFKTEAEDLARRWYNANASLYKRTGTVWENLSPEQCVIVKAMTSPDFCGWGALAPVAIPAEFGWPAKKSSK